MAYLNEEEWLSVKQACAEFDISEPALRKTLRKERLEPGSGVASHHFADQSGVSVSRADLTAYIERTRASGEKPRGRPRTRPLPTPALRGPGRPPKAENTQIGGEVNSADNA